MNSTIQRLEPHILPLSFESWLLTLGKSLKERPQYKVENNHLHFGQVVARFIGIPIDEDEYYNQLYDLVHDSEVNVILLSEDTLDKRIENDKFQAIQKVLQINQEQKLSVNRFVAFLDGERLLVRVKSPGLNRRIREAMIKTLQFFSDQESQGLQNPELRRVLVDVVKWTFNHFAGEVNDIDLQQGLPKYLWYGNFKKSHTYFLYYLMEIGCDCVIFHPNGHDVFAQLEQTSVSTFVHHFPNKKEPEPFPTEKRQRKTTVAYRASREIETILNHEGSYYFKPWQLRDYTPRSITLKTTYDELFLIAKEIAMVRPDFEVNKGVVKIPNVFAKVHGVSKNRKEYWDRMHQLVENDDSLLIRQFPFSRSVNNDFRFHYRNALGADGLLVPEKMMESNYWRYSHLPYGLQKGIAMAIRNICKRTALKPIYRESEEELKIYLFTQGMQIPTNILKLLQKFDYSQSVPKLVIYNNEMNGLMTRTDAALLLLLNQFGIDIILYNPQGHNDIENFIDEKIFDTHWLEDVIFELEYKEPSIVKRILRNLRGD